MLIRAINNSDCLYFRNKYAEYNTEKIILSASQLAETVGLLWAVVTAQNAICIWPESCQQALSKLMQSCQGIRNHLVVIPGLKSSFWIAICQLWIPSLTSFLVFVPAMLLISLLFSALFLCYMPNFSIIFTSDIYRDNFSSNVCLKELPSSFYHRHTQRCLSGFDTHTLSVA